MGSNSNFWWLNFACSLFESKVGLYSNRGSDMENVPTQSVLLVRCDTFSMLVYEQLVYHVGQWRMQDTGFSLGYWDGICGMGVYQTSVNWGEESPIHLNYIHARVVNSFYAQICIPLGKWVRTISYPSYTWDIPWDNIFVIENLPSHGLKMSRFLKILCNP